MNMNGPVTGIRVRYYQPHTDMDYHVECQGLMESQLWMAPSTATRTRPSHGITAFQRLFRHPNVVLSNLYKLIEKQ